MLSTDDRIADRIRFVARRPERADMASLMEAKLKSARVYEPRKCLLTACSTPAEEEGRWRFLGSVKGASEMCIKAAQAVVGKQLREGFGIEADWDVIQRPARPPHPNG